MRWLSHRSEEWDEHWASGGAERTMQMKPEARWGSELHAFQASTCHLGPSLFPLLPKTPHKAALLCLSTALSWDAFSQSSWVRKPEGWPPRHSRRPLWPCLPALSWDPVTRHKPRAALTQSLLWFSPSWLSACWPVGGCWGTVQRNDDYFFGSKVKFLCWDGCAERAQTSDETRPKPVCLKSKLPND